MRARGISDDRHHDDAGRQPAHDPRGRRPLLMRRRGAPGMTLLQPELLAQLAGAFPDAVAWRNLADGSELTLRRVAPALQPARPGPPGARSSRRGDRVGLLIGNDEPLEWLVSYLAIHKAGAVAVPLLARLGPVRARPHPRARRGVGRPVQRGPRRDPLRGADRGQHRGQGARAPGRPPRPRRGRPRIRRSARTTWPTSCTPRGPPGGPRASSCAHGGLSTTGARPVRLARGWASSRARPSPRPAAHCSCAVPCAAGCSGWFLPRFDPDRWIAAVERDRPVAAFLVPAMVELIVGCPRFGTADLSSLAVVNIGSAPIAAATLRRFGAGLPGGGDPVRVRDDRVRRGHGNAPGRRRDGTSDRSAFPCPGSRSGSSTPAGTTLAPGEVGQVTIGGSRARAVVPRRPRRHRAHVGRRVALERRSRLPRRRRPPLDRGSPEGDHHPGRPQRGAR